MSVYWLNIKINIEIQMYFKFPIPLAYVTIYDIGNLVQAIF